MVRVSRSSRKSSVSGISLTKVNKLLQQSKSMWKILIITRSMTPSAHRSEPSATTLSQQHQWQQANRNLLWTMPWTDLLQTLKICTQTKIIWGSLKRKIMRETGSSPSDPKVPTSKITNSSTKMKRINFYSKLRRESRSEERTKLLFCLQTKTKLLPMMIPIPHQIIHQIPAAQTLRKAPMRRRTSKFSSIFLPSSAWLKMSSAWSQSMRTYLTLWGKIIQIILTPILIQSLPNTMTKTKFAHPTSMICSDQFLNKTIWTILLAASNQSLKTEF